MDENTTGPVAKNDSDRESPVLRVQIDVKALEALRDAVRDEYAAEWQRKSAFETRAFAVITANLAVVTFLLALADRNGVVQAVRTGVPGDLVTVALVINGLSVLCALASAFPLHYQAIQPDGFTAILGRITGSDRLQLSQLVQQTIEAKVEELASAKKANRFKAAASLAAFGALVLAAILDTVAVFLVL